MAGNTSLMLTGPTAGPSHYATMNQTIHSARDRVANGGTGGNGESGNPNDPNISAVMGGMSDLSSIHGVNNTSILDSARSSAGIGNI
jgi:hypothetical protein